MPHLWLSSSSSSSSFSLLPFPCFCLLPLPPPHPSFFPLLLPLPGGIQQISMLLQAEGQNLTPVPQGQQPAPVVFAKRFRNPWLVSNISGEICWAELCFCIKSGVYPSALPSPSLSHHSEAPLKSLPMSEVTPGLTGKPGTRGTPRRPAGDTCLFPGRATGVQRGMDICLGHLAAK